MVEGDANATETAASGRSARAAPLERGGVLGRYTILEKLGEGGMGMVYAAYDPDLDRKVALKLLRTGGDPDARRRLLHEGRAMAKLSHPNVVTVFEVGTVGERDYVAMEHIDGPTLESWITARRPEAERGRRQARQVASATLALFDEVGRGLAAAHDAGLVHRDLKPSNILIGGDGRARVGDFGIARAVGEHTPAGHADSDDNTASAFFGTPAYMAPEQLLGGVSDARSDQFAFCVALYQALFGKRPFTGSTTEDLALAHAVGVEFPDGDSPVGAHVRRAIARGLSPKPEDRFATMDALLASLRGTPQTRGRMAAVTAVAAASLVGGLLLLGNTPAAENSNRCAAPAERLEGIWDNGRREVSRSAFRATRLPYADEAHDSYAGALDAYTRDWSDAYQATCRQTYEEKSQDESVHALRLACLQDRLGHLRSLTRVFESARPDDVEQAARAAASLPAVDDCNDVVALEKGIAPPAEGDERYQVAVLRTDLARARTLQDVGRLEDAETLAESAARQAGLIAYTPLRAEAMYRLGSIHMARARVSAARQELEEAALLAEESGYDSLRARALVTRAELLATTSSDRSAVELATRKARAAVARTGSGAALEGELSRALGKAAMADGDVTGAQALLSEAIGQYRRAQVSVPGNSPRVRIELAATLARHAEVALEARDFDAALESATEALTLAEAEHGAEHPVAIRYLEVLGWAQREAGNLIAARDAFARTRRFYASERGKQIADQAPPEHQMPPVTSLRDLRGRVVDASGAPLAGARVTVSRWLAGDSERGYASYGGISERHAYTRITTTDADGQFAVQGVPDSEVIALAESDEFGRSWPLVVAAGASEIELALKPFGSLRGRITRGGQAPPLQELRIQAIYAPSDERSGIIGVLTRDGHYRFDRLPEGEYDVFFGRMGREVGANLTLASRRVTVRAGELTELDVDLGTGTVELDIGVAGKHGAPIASAQVILFTGKVDVSSSEEINRHVLDGKDARSSFVTADGRAARFPDVPPGTYSACVVPLAGDYRDPEYRRGLYDKDKHLRSHCFVVEISESPHRQVHELKVPPMQFVN